eukprot:CAMPEP_0171463236 /NCGR_PEP_ID=MMETSP0945-20130129/6975_1 /TAXON_ID=109269 /ORGANISM="Vaucheria litorea, Strain CCMP2940" /LENGTH=270 /DNA_ID=CAMNT_0011989963 /DNA_START=13 /DNA_END=825 /DNA_ORIENTATION=+
MPKILRKIFHLSTISLLISAISSYPLSVVVNPGQKSCFYELIQLNSPSTRKVELFVLDGNDMSIGLSIRGPFKQTKVGHPNTSARTAIEIKEIISDQDVLSKDPFRFGENYEFKFKTEAGVYEICLDNSNYGILKAAPKVIQLSVTEPKKMTEEEMTTQREEESAKIAKEAANQAGSIANEDDLNALALRLLRLRDELDKIERKQNRERRRLAVHSISQEKAKSDMVFGSIVETAIFIGTSIFQLLFISRWFRGGKGCSGGRGKGNNQWA